MKKIEKIQEIKRIVRESSIAWIKVYVQTTRNGEKVFYKSIPSDRNLKIMVTSKEAADRYINFIAHLQL